ncbi:MAG: hypothetical protein V1740_00370 [Candidatus Woesearchaeota archaeon]
MEKKKIEKMGMKKKNACKDMGNMCKGGGGIYFLGMVGALVYYVSTATGFWDGAWGIIKALLWPGFLIFELMKYLGM